MQQSNLWKRRSFMQILGGSTAAAAVAGGVHASKGLPWLSSKAARWAFIGCAGDKSTLGEIQAYAVGSRGWTRLQTVASERPAALAVHPSGHFLYAANETDAHAGLPRATVEAYRIGANGHLHLLNRQALSLSATRPRHLAVSPDGRQLAVAVTGGGAYNLVPIAEDGRLQPVAAILKETGAGPLRARQEAAHPRGLTFDAAGSRLLAADLGTDRLSVLEIDAFGADPLATELRVSQRVAATPGSGPSQIVLHPNGRMIYVLNELDGSLSGFGYDAGAGRVTGRRYHLARLPQASAGPARLAMHPAGRFLFVSYPRHGAANADQIAVWRIATATGVLQPVQGGVEAAAAARFAALAPSRDRLFAVDFRSGSVVAWHLDAATGRLDHPATVAQATSPLSLALV